MSLMDETLAAPRPDGLEKIMRHSPEKLVRFIDDLKYSGLAKLVRLGLPWYPAEQANERILELECELIRLRAELDRERFFRLWDEP